jgi:hypothetical protein
MYIMLGDEADADQGRGQKFFVYGAVFIDADEVDELHDGIQKIRDDFGYGATDSLKFSNCPKDITREEHRDVKKAIVKLARKHNVVFCAYAISHGIANGETHDNLVLFGANTLLGKFNEFLNAGDGVGIVLMDRIPVANPYKYLKDKFQIGLQFPSGGTRKLDRIVGYASTCDGASHLASIADILLGSFRYCLNEPDKNIANAAIFPTLVRVMWCRETKDGTKNLREYGLTLRPEEIKVASHQKDYDDLVERLSGYLKKKEED